MNLFNRPLDQQNGGGMRYDYRDPSAVYKLAMALKELLVNLNYQNDRPLVVLAIGTDRSTGDSLGPLVGNNLERAGLKTLYVHGTLERPVHAGNLAAEVDLIGEQYSNPVILAVDACLGKPESIGQVILAPGPLRPGAGVNKNLPAVGNLQITGIVNVGGSMEFLVLQNTRLNLVYNMAEFISRAIHRACLLVQNSRPIEQEVPF